MTFAYQSPIKTQLEHDHSCCTDPPSLPTNNCLPPFLPALAVGWGFLHLSSSPPCTPLLLLSTSKMGHPSGPLSDGPLASSPAQIKAPITIIGTLWVNCPCLATAERCPLHKSRPEAQLAEEILPQWTEIG